MNDTVKFHSLEFIIYPATIRTEWVHALFRDKNGVISLVELMKTGSRGDAIKHLVEGINKIRGKTVNREDNIPDLLGLTDEKIQSELGLACAVSALRTATTQFQSEYKGKSLTEELGGESSESIPLYANINRSLLVNRSPGAFAHAAELAVRSGFSFIKCAPFDEVAINDSKADKLRCAKTGIQRVVAIKRTVGKDITVFVDCHQRFDEQTALIVFEKLAEVGIGWFEEPLPEGNNQAMARILKAISCPLVGGECRYGKSKILELISSRACDIVMPDIKFCGGVTEARKVGQSIANTGGKYSLHCPSGPVSLLASAHVTAAVKGAYLLEHAVNEISWRADILSPREQIEKGKLWFPGGKGLGAILNASMLKKHGRIWIP